MECADNIFAFFGLLIEDAARLGGVLRSDFYARILKCFFGRSRSRHHSRIAPTYNQKLRLKLYHIAHVFNSQAVPLPALPVGPNFVRKYNQVLSVLFAVNFHNSKAIRIDPHNSWAPRKIRDQTPQ
jgi:hypothetical protein